jgi:hypothetical protein
MVVHAHGGSGKTSRAFINGYKRCGKYLCFNISALRERLEGNGVLGNLRAQVRGEIFKALDAGQVFNF